MNWTRTLFIAEDNVHFYRRKPLANGGRTDFVPRLSLCSLCIACSIAAAGSTGDLGMKICIFLVCKTMSRIASGFSWHGY